MAATMTGFAVPATGGALAAPIARTNRRRRITQEAGRALEILGHAIEYLTDEYVHETEKVSAQDPQVQAVQTLMALNRQIYYACPVAPSFTERLRTFFHATRH